MAKEEAVEEEAVEVLKNFLEEEDQWNSWNKSYIKLLSVNYEHYKSRIIANI